MKKFLPALALTLLIVVLLTPKISGQATIPVAAARQGVLASGEVVETANTNLDGTGTLITLGSLAQDSYVHRVVWNSLGTNAVCVGRIFADSQPRIGATVDRPLVVESTLAATTASNTAALTPVSTTINGYFPAGTMFYASVSVDLTSSAGYTAIIYLGDHGTDF